MRRTLRGPDDADAGTIDARPAPSTRISTAPAAKLGAAPPRQRAEGWRTAQIPERGLALNPAPTALALTAGLQPALAWEPRPALNPALAALAMATGLRPALVPEPGPALDPSRAM